MNIAGLLTGGLVDSVVGGLKAAGILKDPALELEAKKLIGDQITKGQDFFLEYFMATVGKDEPWYSPSKLFRPLCSFAITTFYIVARFRGYEFTSTDQAILFGVIGFWFGGRTIEKLVGRQ